MKKVLFITSNIIPCTAGDSIYSYGVVYRLSKYANVDVIAYGDDKVINDFYYSELLNRINNIYIVKFISNYKNKIYKMLKYKNSISRYSDDYIKKLRDILEKNRYNIVIIDHLRMHFVYNFIKDTCKYDIKIILIEHNVETQNVKEELKNKTGIDKVKFWLKNLFINSYERKSISSANEVWTISKNDKEELLKLDSKLNVKVVSPFFPYERIKFEYKQNKKLLILGSMGWYPNVEGTCWFIENIFNRILSIDNEYKLYIVGSNPDKKLFKYINESIIITGRVVSVDEYIKNSDLLIVPNKLGGGVKIKILEGIMKGIPVVSVKESLVGYEKVITNKDFIINSDKVFAENILRINSDENYKKKFVETSRSNMLRYCDMHLF